ncbi:MAG TPA: hypothetical protein VMQ93_12960 [Novosphingobium sp.]|nr:hypothetical protein [Novosphingobium sp.]
MALLVALGSLVVFLRRRPRQAAEEWAEIEAREPATITPEKPPTAPAPVDTVSAQAAPIVPAPAFAPRPPAPVKADIDLAFEPASLRLSLVYATLQYRVSITVRTDLAAGQLVGDMIGAHASIPPEMQLAPEIATLARLKVLPPVAAGQTVALTGEIQLPLGAIRSLQQGNASFFVPLVRLCILGEDGVPLLRRVHTVGVDNGGGALAPLRLDTGPRDHRELASREVEAARAYPLQPPEQRAAG